MTQDDDTTRWVGRIGNRIRERRKALGLSLADLSRLSGSTVPTLSHIERGTRDVRLSTLVSLATALRVELPALFAEDDRDPKGPPPSGTGGYRLDDD